ncbi:putative dimethylaniline monooxygenase [Hypoxylon sp. NC1633]|nr:putative dimethylaniline monooxygenase [Hypoxylon sp. NC1633]
MSDERRIRSVAVVGAGAAGAITAAALKAEDYFERIRVFERRETPGGTWIFDSDPKPDLAIRPGRLPSDIDPPLEIPKELPQVTTPNQQERYSKTPIYNSLTTNVPDIAMCFSDRPFAYGPFTPHHVPRQYIENYFSFHKTDSLLSLNTTVEDISKQKPSSEHGLETWKLTLRKYDPSRHIDIWWEEVFDAVILANGHYSVPYIPYVKGLAEYARRFPGRVSHSKYYRSPVAYTSKRVLLIGNSASGHDLTTELVSSAAQPVYQSRRSRSRWDGATPPPGVCWKPVIQAYTADGSIEFGDGTHLGVHDIDAVIYCTGYKPSFPFWNTRANGGPLWDYADGDRLATGHGPYWHTFFRAHPSLGVVGVPRVLTFRSFEYQAVALARLFSGRNAAPLPPAAEQRRWECGRLQRARREGTKFHDIAWEGGETVEWLAGLFRIAGLGTLAGEGRIPPPLTREMVWAIEHIKKYPEPELQPESESVSKSVDRDGKEMEREGVGRGNGVAEDVREGGRDDEWLLVERPRKDLLGFL